MTSLRSSSVHNTSDVSTTAVAHCAGVNASVPNVVCRTGTCTTAICNTTPSARDAHSHRFVNRCENALATPDRALSVLNSWAKPGW